MEVLHVERYWHAEAVGDKIAYTIASGLLHKFFGFFSCVEQGCVLAVHNERHWTAEEAANLVVAIVDNDEVDLALGKDVSWLVGQFHNY